MGAPENPPGSLATKGSIAAGFAKKSIATRVVPPKTTNMLCHWEVEYDHGDAAEPASTSFATKRSIAAGFATKKSIATGGCPENQPTSLATKSSRLEAGASECRRCHSAVNLSNENSGGAAQAIRPGIDESKELSLRTTRPETATSAVEPVATTQVVKPCSASVGSCSAESEVR